MTRHLAFVVVLAAIGLVIASRAEAGGWIFRRSSFTHHPVTGDRVVQFAPKKTPYVRGDGTYQQSAYRHVRSTIRAGGSADHTHIVQTWGAGEAIRPYGEWQRPFREGATPYGPWGNPYGPWTTPFGSWTNPYGLGRLPYPYWRYWPYGADRHGPPLPEAPSYDQPQAANKDEAAGAAD